MKWNNSCRQRECTNNFFHLKCDLMIAITKKMKAEKILKRIYRGGNAWGTHFPLFFLTRMLLL